MGPERNISRSGEGRDVRCFQHLQTGAVAVRLVRLSDCLPPSAGFFGRPASPHNVNATVAPSCLVGSEWCAIPKETIAQNLKASSADTQEILASSRQPGSDTVHVSVVPVSLPLDMNNNNDRPC